MSRTTRRPATATTAGTSSGSGAHADARGMASRERAMNVVQIISSPSFDQVLVSGASLRIDQDLAARLLAECPYDGQRALNDDRALLLAAAMEHGTFMQNTQIAFARCDGRYFLVNGQHRLNAITLAQQAQAFRIEVYDCRSRDEVDACYCRFDQPGGQRSLTQVSRSLGLHDSAEGGLRPATAALLLRSVPMLMIGRRRIAPSQRPRDTRDLDVKRDFAMRWKPWAIDYQSCLDQGIGQRTGRYRAGGVFAVALVTLRYQNAKAREFWGPSIRNNGLLVGDPRGALHSHFLSAKRATSEYDLAEAAVHAWNAWFGGRQLTMCKVLGASLAPRGTPFTGEA
ncbi:hypothetical protein [Rhodoplanes serenus]|nr:hypothetical protein [Rhodoplanes serenus]